MKDFACIDDSLVYKDGLYVYTHAVVHVDEPGQVLTITGNKKSIYNHEQSIVDFLEEIYQDSPITMLYACSHYKQYSTVWDYFVDSDIHEKPNDLPKLIRNTFTQAHHLAKQESKTKLILLLEQISQEQMDASLQGHHV